VVRVVEADGDELADVGHGAAETRLALDQRQLVELLLAQLGNGGIAELVGKTTQAGTENFLDALVATASVALGILAGTLVVRAARVAARTTAQRGITRSG